MSQKELDLLWKITPKEFTESVTDFWNQEQEEKEYELYKIKNLSVM